MNTLAAFLINLAAPLARQVLVSLGIGLVTFAGLDVAVTGALNAAKANMGQIPSAAAAILARGGVFTAMAIIAGGITAGVSMIALKRLGKIA